MSARSNFPPYEVIDAKLQSVVQSLAELPPWHAAWKRLTPDSSDEDRLAVFRAIREDGCLPEDAGFYLVSYQTDIIVFEHADIALRHLEEQMVAIQKAHGLHEDEKWPPGEVPADYEAARLAYHDAWGQLFLDRLEADGEHEMVRLLRSSRDEYDRQMEAGRVFFFGERSEDDDVDAWLDDLLGEVGGCIEAQSIMGPLGCRYSIEDDFFEVIVYPTPVELVGGAGDGEVVAPDFMLNLEQLRAAFDSIDDFCWNALGHNDPYGPHVSVEGIYQGRQVYLQILAAAPVDEEPGTKFDVNKKIWR